MKKLLVWTLVIILIIGIVAIILINYIPKTPKSSALVWSDSQGKMDWDSAVVACSNLGAGWRLPTTDELTVALTDQFINSGNNPGGFLDNPSVYWTNNEDIEEQYRVGFARVVGYSSKTPTMGVYPNALGKTVKVTASARCVLG
jgi:hypothetical protein